MTMEQHLQREGVDWLVKSPEVWDWFCWYQASDGFRAMSEQNWVNWQSKPLVHYYSMDGHIRKMQRTVRKTQNSKSQLLCN
jgi:hypothetical protein